MNYRYNWPQSLCSFHSLILLPSLPLRASPGSQPLGSNSPTYRLSHGCRNIDCVQHWAGTCDAGDAAAGGGAGKRELDKMEALPSRRSVQKEMCSDALLPSTLSSLQVLCFGEIGSHLFCQVISTLPHTHTCTHAHIHTLFC